MTKQIKCIMEIEDDGIVTLRGRRGEMLAKIRCDMDGFGTFTRIQEGEDCDNYWIAVKPSDHAVFGDWEAGVPPLFSRAKMVVEEFKFRLEKK